MSYVPKKRIKIKWKIVGPLLLLLALLIYILFSFVLNTNKSEDSLYTLCDFSQKETVEKLNVNEEKTIQISDYLYYGETLNIFEETYNAEELDPLIGSRTELVNLCSGERYPFILEQFMDKKIRINELPVGVYAIYISRSYEDYRLTFDEEIKDEFYAVSSFGKAKKAEFLATKNILKDYDIELSHHYVYLSIKEEAVPSDIYDVIIDPGKSHYDRGGLDLGYEANGLNEIEENVKSALLLKEKLEAAGLKVLVTRSKASEIIDTYGVDGRLAMGYNAKAKYYILLEMNASDYEQTSGLEILHSSYSSSSLGNMLMFNITKETSLKVSNYSGAQGKIPGVNSPVRIVGKLDGRAVYDIDLYVRESGGIATQAGRYSESSQVNESFAKDNIYGMQGIVITYGYISNEEDAKIWKAEHDKIISATANSLLTYIRVEVKE